MNIKGIDPYKPCFCGSGKKFRFCCGQTNPFVMPSPEEHAQYFYFLNKGLKFSGELKFEEALPWFKKAMEVTEVIPSATNNLAACLCMCGRVNEAIELQRECFTKTPFPNPYGVAGLALFFLISGRDEDARRAIMFALELDVKSEDGAVKICEVLAHLELHEEIVKFVKRVYRESKFETTSMLRYFIGVAAANIGDTSLALRELSGVKWPAPHAGIAGKYCQLLRDGSLPDTPGGNWLYFDSAQYMFQHIGKNMDKEALDALFSTRYALHMAESLLVTAACETRKSKSKKNRGLVENAFGILSTCTHPDTVTFLRNMLTNSFGTDDIRMKAYFELLQRGEIKEGDDTQILVGKKKIDTRPMTFKLSSGYQQYELPPEIKVMYEAIIEDYKRAHIDWNLIEARCAELLNICTNYPPLRYNYAVALMNGGKKEKGATFLARLCEEEPVYLQARATYLRFLCENERFKDAASVIKNTPEITIAHPVHMCSWLRAQAFYQECKGKKKEAKKLYDSADEIANADI